MCAHDESTILYGPRIDNVYAINLNSISPNKFKALLDDTWLRHRRLGHASMQTIEKLFKYDLVRGLPLYKFEKDCICDACVKGKQVRSSFKPKKCIITSHPLELLHIDICGPIPVRSLKGSSYILVIVDDYSCFTWVSFLKEKNEAFHEFSKLCKQLQICKNVPIVSVRSDHGREFDHKEFTKFCNEFGISHNFSAPRTPQQNGVVERKTAL